MKNKNKLKNKAVHFCIMLFVIFHFGIMAREVPLILAQKVADNFYKQQSGLQSISSSLIYTAFDSNKVAIYYGFDFNGKKGFVLVSADDAANPIIGYSTNENFKKPNPQSNLGLWLSRREKEISFLRQNNISSNNRINELWNYYADTKQVSKNSALNYADSQFVEPLLSTTWNQSPFYNDSCPEKSKAGCVATAMAQIMKYWSYPEKGFGYSNYCNCKTAGFLNQYGNLHADYTGTYNWDNMPAFLAGDNADVAKIIYHCGVSVETNYDPAGSSAWVIKADNFISAEHSYVAYFGYDPHTILGLKRLNYSDNDWLSTLKNNLNLRRPVQYVGFGNVGGHTWVCDGYDVNDFFHMNWGWGGAGNGYYNINSLNPYGMNFAFGQEGLFGIVPNAANDLDVGVVSVSQSSNCSDVFYSPILKIKNFGKSNLTNFIINYKLDSNSVQTINWTGLLITGQSLNVPLLTYTLSNGDHTLNAYIEKPNNHEDDNSSNNQLIYAFQVFTPNDLPVYEGFETQTILNKHWITFPSTGGSDWTLTNRAFSSGLKSMMIDNMNNTAGNVSIMQCANYFDLNIAGKPYISFKVAYKKKLISNDDELRLEFSNDCGNSWYLKWNKRGSELASEGLLPNEPFVPLPQDFISHTVSVPNDNNIIFRWVFIADINGVGNNIYLDDINVYDKTVNVKENISANENDFELFPNPANGFASLKFKVDDPLNIKINVVDIYGRKVIDFTDTELKTGEQNIAINKNGILCKGFYFVTLLCNDKKTIKKLVIE